jgi:hypothetical protein
MLEGIPSPVHQRIRDVAAIAEPELSSLRPSAPDKKSRRP